MTADGPRAGAAPSGKTSDTARLIEAVAKHYGIRAGDVRRRDRAGPVAVLAARDALIVYLWRQGWPQGAIAGLLDVTVRHVRRLQRSAPLPEASRAWPTPGPWHTGPYRPEPHARARRGLEPVRFYAAPAVVAAIVQRTGLPPREVRDALRVGRSPEDFDLRKASPTR